MNQTTLAGNTSKQSSDETFQVALNGIQVGASPVEVRAKLATLFKASAEQAERLVVTHGYVIKKGCSLEVATKFKNAIDATGAVCELVPESKPTVVLDADLPDMAKPPEPPSRIDAVPVTAMPTGDSPAPNGKISEAWRLKFDLLEKAGGPKFTKMKDLTFGERLKVASNVWGFLFGPFYYLSKGMWKKAISLVGVAFVLIFFMGMVFGALDITNSALTNFVAPAIFAVRANIDYYKKMVLGQNGWW